MKQTEKPMTNLSERIKQTTFENNAQEAMIALLAASAHLRDKLNNICSTKDLSIQQFNILRILKGVHPAGYPRCEISARMVERAPDITRILDRMVKSGLVQRTKSPNDLRQSIAIITEKGVGVLLELNERIKHFQVSFEKTIAAEKSLRLSQICNEILSIK